MTARTTARAGAPVRLFLLVAVAALTLSAVVPGAEAARRKRSPWHFGVEATSDFPLALGGRLSLEAPHRIRVATLFGAIPDFYVDGINAVFLAAGAYSDETGAIVSDALQSSFVWRIQAGWRPFDGRGFYFELGYLLATLEANVAGQTLFDAAVSVELPPGASLDEYTRRTYQIESMLHMVAVEVGWEWIVDDAWVFRVAGGFAATIASSTEAGYRRGARGTLAVDDVSAAYAIWLDDVYTSVLFVPVVTTSVGLRLY